MHFLTTQKEFEDERTTEIGEIFIYELSKSPQDEEMIDNDNEDIGSFYKKCKFSMSRNFSITR